MSKGMTVNEPDDGREEEVPMPDLPAEVTVANRRYKRKKGARSSYADRLRQLQKGKLDVDDDE